jgi:hypothetical protein
MNKKKYDFGMYTFFSLNNLLVGGTRWTNKKER